MVKVTINGISYDAAPEVANELARLNGAIEQVKKDAATEMTTAKAAWDSEKTGLQAKFTEQKATSDGLQAKVDGLENEKKDLKAKVDGIPQAITDGVKARVALIQTAAKVLSDEEYAKLDSMSNQDIKAAVIKARNPKVDLKDKSEAYMDAAFTFATANLDEDRVAGALAASRRVSAPVNDSSDMNGDSQDAAKARYLERLKNGGKLPEKKA
jgi:hypothetical protein